MGKSNFSIFIDARLVNNSGIGRYIAEIVPILASKFKVMCLTTNKGVGFMEVNNINYIISEAKIYSIKEQYDLYKLVGKCDLFWSPHFNIPLLPIKAKYRLVTIHDAYHLAFSKELSIFERIYAKVFYTLALTLSDQVITVSKFSKDELIKYTNTNYGNKINVIYNGVTDFALSDIQHREDRTYWLFVGNVKPHKNLKNAILAFKKFRLNNPLSNLMFKIVGQREGFINGDNEVQKLLLTDNELSGLVVFTGYVNDEQLIEIYKRAICLIFPSLYEGFGLPPLESMKCGTPAIVSNRASMPELCGNATIYFDPEDVESIVSAMTEIAYNSVKYDHLAKLGKIQVAQYKWSICAEEHIKIINKFIEI